MKRLFAAGALALMVAGCGGSTSTPPAATSIPAVSILKYRDPNFGFSFNYPSNWKVPKAGGHEMQAGGVRTYVLDITPPTTKATLSITVDGQVIAFPSFVDGHVGHIASDPTHTYQYFHATVSGWKSMLVHRFTGKQITELDVLTNTHTRSYDVRALTAYPPFPADIENGYTTIWKSLKVPFT